MKNGIVLLPINKLKSHEAVSQSRAVRLAQQIKKEGYLKNPLVVDKETKVILDGHHRLSALKAIGCQKVPALLVDYKSKKVRVFLRRKNLAMKILKETVLQKAALGELFPCKTTRHYLPQRPRIKVLVEELKKMRE